jgi:hypothetical protein
MQAVGFSPVTGAAASARSEGAARVVIGRILI